jgi:hypothetical protein
MSSITIHDIDKELDSRITKEARRRKISKNRLIKELLAGSVGLPYSAVFADDYSEFCGLWNREELDVFNSAQEKNRQIDDADWSQA